MHLSTLCEDRQVLVILKGKRRDMLNKHQTDTNAPMSLPTIFERKHMFLGYALGFLDFYCQLLQTGLVQLPCTYFELRFVYLGLRVSRIILNFNSGRVVNRFLSRLRCAQETCHRAAGHDAHCASIGDSMGEGLPPSHALISFPYIIL